MKLNNGAINVEPVAWNLMNNKTTRAQAEARAEREQIDGVPIWIIANLKRYGNCYIAKMRYELETISHLCGFSVSYQRCVGTQGYVLFKEDTR